MVFSISRLVYGTEIELKVAQKIYSLILELLMMIAI